MSNVQLFETVWDPFRSQRLHARLEDLRVPMPINMTLVGSAERALRELYENSSIVGEAEVAILIGAVLYTLAHERETISHRVGYAHQYRT